MFTIKVGPYSFCFILIVEICGTDVKPDGAVEMPPRGDLTDRKRTLIVSAIRRAAIKYNDGIEATARWFLWRNVLPFNLLLENKDATQEGKYDMMSILVNIYRGVIPTSRRRNRVLTGKRLFFPWIRKGPAGYLMAVALLVFLGRLPAAADPVLTGTSEGMRYRVEKVAEQPDIPWGMAFLGPNGLIFTGKNGQVSLLDPASGKRKLLQTKVDVMNRGQGGLLDVAVPPGYQPGDWIYFTYSKPQGKKSATALARARLSGDRLSDWRDLLVTRSATGMTEHFGSRIAFDGRGHLFFSIGDRGDRENAQDLTSHAGSILRVLLDGSAPEDNPFTKGGGLAEIWSFGHRNSQGLAYDRSRARLWSIEHGPRGGDEINIIQPGGNYGWPVVSHGMEYWGPVPVGEATHKAGMIDPVKVYIPSIAPGSLLLYGGAAFPRWRGNLFAGALVLRHLNRVVLDGDLPVQEERLLLELKERIRALAESPEGWIYFSTDSGRIYRIRPFDSADPAP
jgi:glucose/arabinose dehydrogenase